MTLEELEEWHKGLDDQFSVPEEERQSTISQLEVGKYPADEPAKYLKSGRQQFDTLKSERIPLVEQVKKARVAEQAMREHDSLLGRAKQTVQDFLTPHDVAQSSAPVPQPSVAQPVTIPPSATAPVPTPDQALPMSTSRFQVEEGEILDTKNRQIISPDQFNRLSNDQEKAEIERQLRAGGFLADDRLYSATIQRGDKWGNVLGHDPLTKDEETNAPFMGGQSYDTQDAASAAAATEAQADYDQQRRDPKSDWYNPALNDTDTPLEIPGVVVTPDNAAPEKPLSFSESMVQATNNFFQGAAGVPAGVLKAVAAASKSVDDLLPEMLKNPQAVESRFTYRLGSSIDRLAKRIFPSDPNMQKQFVIGVLPQALGSMTGFMAGGLAGLAAKAPTATTAVLGAAVGGAEQFDDAAAHKASPEVEQKAFWLGSAVGSSEALPIAGILNRFNKSTGGKFITVLKELGITGAQEFLQEWGQQVGSNAIAQALYDENRSLFDGAGMAGEAGGASGMIVGFLSGLLQGRKARRQHQNEEATSTNSPLFGEALEKPDLTAGIPESLHTEQRPPFLIKQQPSPAAPGLPPAPVSTAQEPAPASVSSESGRPLEQPVPGVIPEAPIEAAQSEAGYPESQQYQQDLAHLGIVDVEEPGRSNPFTAPGAPSREELYGEPVPEQVMQPETPSASPPVSSQELLEPVDTQGPVSARQLDESASQPVEKQEVSPTPERALKPAEQAVVKERQGTMWAKVQAGETQDQGYDSPILQAAKPLYEAGALKSADDLRSFVGQLGPILSQDLPPSERDAAISGVIQQWMPEKVEAQAAAPTPHQAIEEPKNAPLSRSRSVFLGKSGQRRIEFADELHAELFDFESKLKKDIAGGKKFDVDHAVSRIKTKLNLPADTNVGALANQYRREVLHAAKNAGNGETVKAPTPQTTPRPLPKGDLISKPIFGGPETVIPAEQPKATQSPTPHAVVDVAAQQAATSPMNNVPTPTEAVSGVSERKPKVNEALGDSVIANAKLFGDGPDAQSIKSQGFQSLSRERQHVVLSQVRAALNDDEVFRAVIKAVPVDVMDSIIGGQLTPDSLLSDKSVLSHRLAVPRDVPVVEPVIRFLDALASTVVGRPTGGATKESPLNPKSSATELPGNTDGAVETVGGDVWHGSIAGQPVEVNTNPSTAQKEAGDYRKGAASIAGQKVAQVAPTPDQAVEKPKGAPIAVPTPNAQDVISTVQYHRKAFEDAKGYDEKAAHVRKAHETVSQFLQAIKASGRIPAERINAYEEKFSGITSGMEQALADLKKKAVPTPDASVAPTSTATQAAAPTPEQAAQSRSKEQASLALATYVTSNLKASGPTSLEGLYALADKEFGGTQAQGKYTPKDVFDAIELGVNRYILDNAERFDPTTTVEQAQNQVDAIRRVILDKIPGQQNRRTEEQVEFQQFSTPPDLAFVMNWAANLQHPSYGTGAKGDVVLEPSAGLGGLAVFAKAAGVKQVYVNEYSDRRADLLKSLPFDAVFTENAEQLNNILPDNIKPTVIVMNPPFSSTAGRIEGQRKTSNVFPHLDQALARLEPGGRLVALIGKGKMHADPLVLERWLANTAKKYAYRARIGLSGKGYKKYGTTYDNQILIFDKLAPTGHPPVTADLLEDVRDALPLLKEIRNARQISTAIPVPGGELPSTRPGSEAVPGARPSGDRSDTIVPPATASVGTDERQSETADTGLEKPRPGARRPAPGQRPAGSPVVSSGQSERPAESIPPTRTPEASHEPKGSGASGVQRPGSEAHSGSGRGGLPPEQVPTQLEIETADLPQRQTELGEGVYQDYVPSKFKIKGAQAHPGLLQESAALAAVDPANISYRPHLPQSLIDKGAVSLPQLEAIAYAGQAHERLLPDGTREGYFLGDGPGVGKGRTIAAMVMDNWIQGRKKAVWLSETQNLYSSAVRDWTALGGKESDLSVINKVKLSAPIPGHQGLMFVTYSTLGSGIEVTRSGEMKAKKVKGGKPDEFVNTRIDQLTRWLGPDFDGIIVFDEAHNMQNAMSEEGEMGASTPAARALAGVELQQRFPNARFLYSSATGATKLNALAYAERLGLWGEGTGFPKKSDFFNDIGGAGLGAMEIVAQNLKAKGSYISRNLSYDGVTYDKIEHELDQNQRDIYNELGRAWQLVLANVNQAMKDTGITSEKNGRTSTKNGRAKAAIMGRFWGTQLRFYNQVLNSLQMPSVIKDMEQRLEAGESIVVQLTNTNESALNRELLKVDAGDGDIGAIDMTPRQELLTYVENAFPVTQFEEYQDDDGNIRSRPVLDSTGKPVENREAVQKRDELLDKLRSLRVPDSPIDLILNTFGPENVAEITGRKQRVVRYVNKSGELVEEREQNRSDALRRAEAAEFMADKRRILIFSEKGGTGESYHADLTKKNQRMRNHYLVQAGWRADKAVQGLGRTHRTNQKQPPRYVLTMTNINGHKRFLSTIARRLDQLGALTKGQRQAGSSGLLDSKDNLENQYATAAIRQLYRDAFKGVIPDVPFDSIARKIGLERVLDSRTGQLNESMLPDVPQFLNRLLTLELYEQNIIFDEFKRRMDQGIEVAAQKGTLDTGMQTYRADGGITQTGSEVVFTDPTSGAKTTLLEFEAKHKTRFISSETPFEQFVTSTKTGKVFGVFDLGNRTDKDGNVTRSYRLSTHVVDKVRYVDEASFHELYAKMEKAKARVLWEKQIQAEPATHTEKVYLVSGSVLNIWKRLPTAFPQITRLKANDGTVSLGIKLTEDGAERLRVNLGVKEKAAIPALSPSQFAEEIVEKGTTLQLVNDWELKRSRVSNEPRIEIVGNNLYSQKETLERAGAYSERIQSALRYFVPTGTSAGDVLARLLKISPIKRVLRSAAKAIGDERGSIPVSPFTKSPQMTQDAKDYRELRAKEERGFISADADIEARVRVAKRGLQPETLREKLKKHTEHVWKLVSREFEDLPDTAEFSVLRTDLLRLAKYKGIAADKVQRDLASIIKPLDRKQYDQFEWKALLSDLKREAEEERALPFGYTAEKVQDDLDRLNQAIEQDPAVRNAWEKRQALWSRLKQDYQASMDAIGFDTSKKLTKDDYFRHQVLEYSRERALKGTGARVRTPTGRGFLKSRQGSTMDINANYVQAEFEVMAQMVYDTQLAKVIHNVDTHYNIRKQLEAAAKTHNREAIQDMIDRGGFDGAMIEVAMKDFAKRIAIPMSHIRKALDLPKGARLSMEQIAAIAEDIDHPARQSALGVFKAINERKKFIRDTLVKQFQTWEQLVPDTHELWQPREGNIFYMADSIPAHLAKALQESMLEEAGIPVDKLRKVLAMGAAREQYVIPTEAAATLNQLSKKEHSWFVEMNRHFLAHWKQLMLIAPRKVLRYNLRNLTGDADALFVGNPRAFKQMPSAAKDLIPVIFKDQPLRGEAKQWAERGGYGTTLQFQELGDINDLKAFTASLDRESKGGWMKAPAAVWNKYWNAARLSTDYREAIMRYAAYLDYLKQMDESPRGRPANFGASIPETVMALPDKRDRAFKLSNELLGAYDRVSVAGQTLRSFWIPFWSWNEVNATRYQRLIRNAFSDGDAGALKRGALVTTKQAATFLVKMAFFWSSLQAWNYLMYGDDEDELRESNPSVANRPHILFGRGEDGKIQYLSGIGALGDLLSWFGLDSFPGLVGDIMHDRMTMGEAIQHAAKAPVNKIWQGLTPAVKLPLEMAVRESTYPDVFNPRPIQDRGDYLGNQVTLGPEIQALRGKPGKPLYGGDDLTGLLVQRTDPKGAAYSTWQGIEKKYLERMGKDSPAMFWRTPKGEALSNWSRAIRDHDLTAETHWKQEYERLEREKYGQKFSQTKMQSDIEKSLRSKAPLAGVTKAERETIVQSLEAQERRVLKKAEAYYQDTMLQVLPEASRRHFERKLQRQGWLTKDDAPTPEMMVP